MPAPERRLLFLIYDLERGGPEVRLLELARLRPAGLGIQILVTSTKVALLPGFQACGVPVSVEPIGRPYLEPWRVKAVRAHVRAGKFDVLNVFDLKGLVIALTPRRIASRNRRSTLVFHSVNALEGLSWLQRVGLLKGMDACDAVLCNSHFSKGLLLAEGLRPSQRIEVIHNGVDAEHYRRDEVARREVRLAHGFGDEDIVLGTVANFRPQKDYRFLLESYRELRAARVRLRLLCVGGGPLLPQMRGLAAALGIGDGVVFTDYVGDVSRHLSAMDAFVLCSKWEGLPNVLLQAMSAGLPVVCSAVGACPEVIDDGVDGLLYASGNRQEFAAAVGRVLGERALAESLRRAALAKVREEFTLAKMVERYADFYAAV